MNKFKTIAFAASGALLLPVISMAAGVSLVNGGLGQAAGDTNDFGVAVCNHGAQAVAQSVLVSVTANNTTKSVSSAPSISAGACAYSYLPYREFGMAAGKTYAVSVTVDPQQTVTKSDTTSYSVTVPGAAQTSQTANVSANNPFSAIWNWFTGLFR